jgi:broad specificity phosphatase PhoE
VHSLLSYLAQTRYLSLLLFQTHIHSPFIFFAVSGQAMHNPRAEALKASGCSYEEFLNQMKDDDCMDAPLTKLGHEQGQAVFEKFHSLYHKHIQLVVSSPLSRAIQTANLAIPSHPNRVCYEHVREINGWLLNSKRKPRRELAQHFPEWNFDELEHDDDVYWTEELETEADCGERGYQTLSWLLERSEERVFMVAHGGILRFLMTQHECITVKDGRQAQSNAREPHARFDNCELRRYRLEVMGPADGDPNDDPDERPRLILTELDIEQTGK